MNTFLRKSVILGRRFLMPRLIVLIDFFKFPTYTGRYCVSRVNRIHISLVNNFPVYARFSTLLECADMCSTVLILRQRIVYEIVSQIFFIATYVLRARTIGVFDTNPRITIVYTICKMFARPFSEITYC